MVKNSWVLFACCCVGFNENKNGFRACVDDVDEGGGSGGEVGGRVGDGRGSSDGDSVGVCVCEGG